VLDLPRPEWFSGVRVAQLVERFLTSLAGTWTILA
jgi:hypothetical protein